MHSVTGSSSLLGASASSIGGTAQQFAQADRYQSAQCKITVIRCSAPFAQELGRSETMIRIDANDITDVESFHTVFATAFGFPSFYGRNMDAWIDCLTCFDDSESGMTEVHVIHGQSLRVYADGALGPALQCMSDDPDVT